MKLQRTTALIFVAVLTSPVHAKYLDTIICKKLVTQELSRAGLTKNAALVEHEEGDPEFTHTMTSYTNTHAKGVKAIYDAQGTPAKIKDDPSTPLLTVFTKDAKTEFGIVGATSQTCMFSQVLETVGDHRILVNGSRCNVINGLDGSPVQTENATKSLAVEAGDIAVMKSLCATYKAQLDNAALTKSPPPKLVEDAKK
jgi:hypothetical protein